MKIHNHFDLIKNVSLHWLNIFRLVAFVISLTFSYAVFGQSNCDLLYDNNWILGGRDDTLDNDKYGGTQITFKPEFGMKVIDKKVNQAFTSASISNARGVQILHTNGCAIYGSNYQHINNGEEINPGEIHDGYCGENGFYSALNTETFLPSMYDSSIYYLIHIGYEINHLPNPFSIVNFKNIYLTTIKVIALDSFEVIEKNLILLTDTSLLGTPISAVKAANGKDWWIVTPDRWTNGYYVFLIDSLGGRFIGKQYIGDVPNPRSNGGSGGFSPDGTKFAWYNPKNNLFLFEFDRTLGRFTSFKRVLLPSSDFLTGGCQFAPNSQLLYVNTDTCLYQLDITADNIESSIILIANYDKFGAPLPTRFLYMALTPDNRIFMNVTNGSQYLHVIQKPNIKGIGCQFEQHTIFMPTVNNFSFPNIPNYRLGTLSDPLCNDVINYIPERNDSKSKITVWPNPASDWIWIESINEYGENITKPIQYSIIDQYGRLLKKSNAIPIDVSDVKSGIYYIQIMFSDEIISCKNILVIH